MSETYPGSSQPLRRPAEEMAAKQAVAAAAAWDAHPVMLPFKGMQTAFYTIGALGTALGRKPNTLREWETAGRLPSARWRTPGEPPHGSIRLYSREQVEGLIEIAREEGLMAHLEPDADGKKVARRKVSETDFGERAQALWDKLKDKK